MRQTSLKVIHELARRDPRTYYIGSDLGSGTLDEMKKEIPERFLMEGISEAALIGMAAGMALNGKIPYVHTIATFLTRRCYEQIAHDLCLHELKVRLLANGGGFVYAPLGPSHQAIEDIAILRALPHMTILCPADAVEIRRAMEAAHDLPGPVYIRLGKGGDPVVTRADGPFVIGQPLLMRPGRDVMIVTTGVCLSHCLAAADLLAARGIDTAVMHLPTVKPVDWTAVLDHCGPVRAMVTVEEHTVIGGLGGAVAEVLAEAGLEKPPRFKRLGIPDCFADQYGSQASLFARYGLDAPSIEAAVTKLLEVR